MDGHMWTRGEVLPTGPRSTVDTSLGFPFLCRCEPTPTDLLMVSGDHTRVCWAPACRRWKAVAGL